MYKVIKETEACDTITIKDAIRMSPRVIVVCEKISNQHIQSILIVLSGGFFWTNFYAEDCLCRTKYESFEDAIKSRFTKGFNVYVLTNKNELKNFIKPRY